MEMDTIFEDCEYRGMETDHRRGVELIIHDNIECHDHVE